MVRRAQDAWTAQPEYEVLHDVEALIRAVCAQDAAGAFRRLVGSTAASAAKMAGKTQAPSGAMGLKRHEQDTQVCACIF
eukprot:scaffold15084_cov21-Tisochrysis_lutea.AAC.3